MKAQTCSSSASCYYCVHQLSSNCAGHSGQQDDGGLLRLTAFYCWSGATRLDAHLASLEVSIEQILQSAVLAVWGQHHTAGR